jgi:ubiquinone biosynthesis accessory factor UbiK
MKVFPDSKELEEMVQSLSKLVPPGLEGVRAEMEANFKAVLQSTFARLELVTQQEFNVQAGVLAKTREMLTSLELRLAELEKKVQEKP